LNILCEHEPRPALLDDAGHLGPEVAWVGSAEALAGDGPRLAREAAGNAVDSASPRGGVEGSDVIVDLEVRPAQAKDLAAVGVDLDGTDRGVPQEFVGQDAAADAGEEVEGVHEKSPATGRAFFASFVCDRSGLGGPGRRECAIGCRR
jgi:hypothetical protein